MKLLLIMSLILMSDTTEWRDAEAPCYITTSEVQNQETQSFAEITDVPFAIVEEVPIFPGCEEFQSNNERRICFSDNIHQFVTDNFEKDVARNAGMTGLNRILGQIRIDTTGKVEVLGVRSPHPAVSEELERVLNLIPEMAPGKQRGKKVNVLFVFPFSFKL